MRIQSKLGGVLSALVIAVSVFLLALSCLPLVFGFKTCVVLDDSMAPQFPVGAFVLAKPVEWDAIHTGDALVFYDPDSRMGFTRIVAGVDEQKKLIATAPSADANPDPMTTGYQSVLGRVVRVFPKLGYPSVWLHTFWGKAVLALLYIIWIAVQIETHSARKRRETSK